MRTPTPYEVPRTCKQQLKCIATLSAGGSLGFETTEKHMPIRLCLPQSLAQHATQWPVWWASGMDATNRDSACSFVVHTAKQVRPALQWAWLIAQKLAMTCCFIDAIQKEWYSLYLSFKQIAKLAKGTCSKKKKRRGKKHTVWSKPQFDLEPSAPTQHYTLQSCKHYLQ